MLLFAVLLLLALLAFALVPSAAQRAVRHLPRPASTLPLLLNALDVRVRHRGRALDFLLAESRRQQRVGGDAWVVQAPGRPVTVVLTSPAAFEHVLRRRFDDFGKGALNAAALRDVLGRGIFAVDGVRWLHQRKTASRLFSLQQLRESMAHAVAGCTAQLCAELERQAADAAGGDAALGGPALDVKRLLDRFTMDVFTKVGFGIDLCSLKASGTASRSAEQLTNAAFLDAFERASRNLVTRFMAPPWVWRLRRWLRVGVEKQIADDVQVIDAFAFGVIRRSIEAKKRRSQQQQQERDGGRDSEPRDLIALFLESDDVDTPANPTFLRDMTVNFLAAGRDTTSQSMTWFLLMLNRHPVVLRRIREEIAAKLPALARGPASAVPSMADVAQLTFLEAALRESIRLNPVVPMNSRTALRDTTLHDGTRIKAGTRVVLPHYVMARLTSVWGADAEQFDPNRWLDARSGQLREVSPFQFSAFLAGPRMCLGMKFALLEMKIAMAAVLSKFDVVTVKDPFGFTYTPSITLAVDGPVDVTVRRVRAATGE